MISSQFQNSNSKNKSSSMNKNKDEEIKFEHRRQNNNTTNESEEDDGVDSLMNTIMRKLTHVHIDNNEKIHPYDYCENN